MLLERPVVVFDIETIPDPDLGRRLPGLSGSDAQVVHEMVRQRSEETEGMTECFALPEGVALCGPGDDGGVDDVVGGGADAGFIAFVITAPGSDQATVKQTEPPQPSEITMDSCAEHQEPHQLAGCHQSTRALPGAETASVSPARSTSSVAPPCGGAA